jgi:hypothetical protein
MEIYRYESEQLFMQSLTHLCHISETFGSACDASCDPTVAPCDPAMHPPSFVLWLRIRTRGEVLTGSVNYK